MTACFIKVKVAHSFLINCLLCVYICVSLKGLNALRNLKELNLADNNIEKIGRFSESSVFPVV